MLERLLNWKTTLAGVLLAALQAVWDVIQSGNVSWKTILFAAATAALGALARDGDKTSE